MAGTLVIDTLNTSSGILSSNNGINGIAKAWVNFNGVSGSVAIRASFNVSSITYNASGNYTINWTTAFSSSNYAVSGLCRRNGSNSDIVLSIRGSTDTGGVLYTTTQCAVTTHTGTGFGLTDSDIVCVSADSN